MTKTTNPGVTPEVPASGRIYHPTLPGVYAEFEWVTPEIASAELKKLEDSQRPRSASKQEQYLIDRLDGNWPFNGATFVYDENGKLVDGQHRYWAIAESGIPSWELVVRGVAEGTIDRMDLGLSRNFRTWLSRRIKPKHVDTVGTTTNMLWNWKCGNYAYSHIARTRYSKHLRKAATSPQLQRTFLTYRQEIENAAIQAAEIKRSVPVGTISAGVISFAWMTLRRLDMDKAEAFFHALKHESARQSDADRAIQVLVNMMRTASLSRKKNESWKWLHYTFAAWNAWILQNPPPEGSYRAPSNPGPRSVAIPIDPANLNGDAIREIYPDSATAVPAEEVSE